MAGPDFDEKTKRTAADRVGNRCTICDKPTHGPSEDPKKATNLGEAAHILGKKRGAPRYDPGMTDVERADIDNALWACRNCHGRFDKDYLHYTVEALRSLRASAEDRARERQCQISDSPVKPLLSRIPQKWCHETTNDHTYVRRAGTVSQLNAWFNEPSTRAISLIGIGGAGKTALVGHWLKVDNQDLIREVRGLFYWSFYVEKDVDQFLLALIGFIEDLGTNFESKLDRTDPLGALEIHFPRLPPLVLLLDGLEVLQQAVSEGRTYGTFIDAKLRDFIQLVAYAKLPWICISTSRFPITDLDYTPNTKCLSLFRLEDEEGADVLNQNGVLGTEDDRRKVTHYLEGHPLALRIFAASIPRELRATPNQHLSNVFDVAILNNKFLDKLFRLLDFYAGSLEISQRAMIQALSLFRSPVPQPTLAILVPTLTDKFVGDTVSLELALTTELGRLVSSGLVIRDKRANTDVYACHPIVRDYFRRDLLGQGDTGRAAIDILTSRPDDLGIQGASNLEPLILACEALLLSGDASAAVELHVARFKKGHVFISGGLLAEGKRIYDAFERFAIDRPKVLAHAQETLVARRKTNFDVIYFRNGAILFNILLGELADAEQLINVQLLQITGSGRAPTYNLQALLAFCHGDYTTAAQIADSAVRAAMQTLYPTGVADLIHAKAHYLRLKAFVLLGLDQEARKANKALLEVRHQLDSADGQILLDLAQLWLASQGNRDSCSKAADAALAKLPMLHEDHLALEARLIAARWYILDQQPKRLAGDLIDEVYHHAVKQSYPYPMISSQIMREYHAYYLGKPSSPYRLKQAATLAEAGHMYGLQAEALWVQLLLEDNPKVQATMRQNIDQLINRRGYTTLSKIYPARVIKTKPQKRRRTSASGRKRTD